MSNSPPAKECVAGSETAVNTSVKVGESLITLPSCVCVTHN
jgi:hypothetical protein